MTTKVGFIGAGQMATALAAGAVQAGVVKPEQLVFSEPDSAQLERTKSKFPGADAVSDNALVFQECQRVILAVKPHILKQIAPSLAASIDPENHLLVSIAAGISLTNLRAWLGTSRVIRVMPNTPSQVGAGASAIAADELSREEDVCWVEQFLGGVGITERVSDELMHAVTGVSGSSPAYIYEVIEAMSDGGVAMGLPRATATRLAAQAVLGAAKMVLETGLHPGVLKDQVTSPGGTTIAALRVLEAAGVRSAFIEAIAGCVDRSQELG